MYGAFPNENALLNAFQSGDDGQRKAAYLALLYDKALERQTIGHVRRHGGSVADGEDVFHDALIIFDRHVRTGKYRNEGRLRGYFMGIVHWCWFNERQLRQKRRNIPLEEAMPPSETDDPGHIVLQNDLRERLSQLIALLSEKCRQLIRLYMLGYKMEEAAEEMGYAGSGVAKKESSLCRKRLRALLLRQTDLIQDIIHTIKG